MARAASRRCSASVLPLKDSSEAAAVRLAFADEAIASHECNRFFAVVARTRHRQRQPSVAPGRFAARSRNAAYRPPGAIRGDSPGVIFKAAVRNAMLSDCNLPWPLRDPLRV